MIIFDQTFREGLVSLVLHIMSSSLQTGGVSEASKLGENFAEIGWKVWEIIETQDAEKAKKINWTGQMLGDLMIISVKTEQIERAFEILKKLLSSPQDILGVPGIDSLKFFLRMAIRENNAVMSLVSVSISDGLLCSNLNFSPS